MATHQHRFGPLHILNADWRRDTWKRWLRSRLAVSEAQAAQAAQTAAAQQAAAKEPPTTTIAPPPMPERTDPGVESRRTDVRSRFDALFDRLLTLEDTLDVLSKRFALNVGHERRQEQRLLDRIEMASDAIERQALALESACSTLERVEQRVDRIERCLRSAGGAATEIRESHRAPAPAPPLPEDDFSDLEEAFSGYDSRSRSVAPEPSDLWDGGTHAGSSIRGNLSEMSLATVLAMLELERRTGVLSVSTDDGCIVTATLRKGTIVGTRSQELEVEPVEAIREALRFTSGQFSFRQTSVEVVSGPPRSVGSVLLEATSRNDEASKAS
jgi:hypothetical protein